ncbi:MAG: tetratricopeptide repeat protein, partial [Bacteroidota bacterium]|nr:tetratricopeptide repeat protein [Bacteroidota bacterium]
QLNLANEKCLPAGTASQSQQAGNDAVIKIRIGIHSGNAEWNDKTYMGYITLARTARVMSSAYGEQVIVSNNTYELCKNKFNPVKEKDSVEADKISFRDLGERRLKDVIQPIRLFQIESKGLRENFPALNTLDARPNNLPIQLTNFIGRETEIKLVKDLLKKTRLLTLTGSGGAGKTRFALQVGAEVIDDFANGVWFIELASLTDPALLAQAVLKVFDLKEETKRIPDETLCDYLKEKQILIMLDNCEHMIGHSAKLAEKLLSKCLKLKILATSREALSCYGEQIHRTLSLETPNPREHLTPEKLTQYESVRLFIERAIAVRSDFRVNNDNAPALAQICYQLDGIPLAIELAAARIKILSVEKIHERLIDRFKFLTGGKRTALPRQQTLRALIDWSYDLLSEKEKTLWKRLSVFSGGWKMEAAEEICSDNTTHGTEVMDILNSLTEKSITIYNEEKERFVMLETIRQYGEDKIKETNEFENFSFEHLKFYLELAETGNKKLRGIDSESTLKVLESEIGNVEKGLKWSIESNHCEEGLRIAAAMGKFWQIRGYVSGGIYWLEAILQKNTENNNSVYCKVICQLGNFARLKGDVDKARKLLDESLKIRRELGDKTGINDSLVRLGILEYDQGRYEQAAELYEEGLGIYRELGDKLGIAIILNNLGNVYSNQGEISKAYKLYEESLATRRENGDKLGISICLNNLGIIAYEQGEYNKATELLQESLQLRNLMGNKDGIAITLLNLGNVSYNQGDYRNAAELYKESLVVSCEIEDKGCIADSLYDLGKVSLIQEDPEQATKFFMESLAMSREIKAKSQIAIALYGLGRVAYVKKEFEQAKKYYYESVALYREAGNNKDIALNILSSAEMHFRDGDYCTGAKLLGFLKVKYFKLHKIKFPKADKIIFDELIAGIKEKLDPEEFSKTFEEGNSLTLDDIIELMLS